MQIKLSKIKQTSGLPKEGLKERERDRLTTKCHKHTLEGWWDVLYLDCGDVFKEYRQLSHPQGKELMPVSGLCGSMVACVTKLC